MADYIPAPDAEFNAWQQNFVIRRGGPTPTWRLSRGSRTIHMQAPFSPRGIALLDARGYLWTARTDRYRLVQFSSRKYRKR